jgi:hypothetical protein
MVYPFLPDFSRGLADVTDEQMIAQEAEKGKRENVDDRGAANGSATHRATTVIKSRQVIVRKKRPRRF